MSEKKAVGLPAEFSIAANSKGLDAPVELGHYLDEDDGLPRPRVRPVEQPQPATPAKARSYGKRKQVNMSTETPQKLDVLVREVRECTVQHDATASEVLDAAISMIYSSRGHFAFG